jgi:hypothetical protein
LFYDKGCAPPPSVFKDKNSKKVKEKAPIWAPYRPHMGVEEITIINY